MKVSSTLVLLILLSISLPLFSQTSTSLAFSTDTVYMNESAGTASFDIISDTTWNVIRPDAATWLTITPTTGVNNGSVTLTAGINLTGAHRMATIMVTGSGVNDTTITVYQAAPPPVGIIDLLPINPTHCGEKGILIISLEGGTDGDIYDIDYTKDGMFDARDTVHNNALKVMNVPVGTQVTHIVLSNIYNKVQSLPLRH